jgi:hypothetical protein
MALVAGPLGAAAVHASPGDDPTEGLGVFTGATLPHPSSVEQNPATLPLGQPGSHVYVSGGGTLAALSVDRRQIDVSTGALGDGPSADAVTTSPLGSVAYWTASRKQAFGLTLDVGPGDVWATTDDDPAADAAMRWASTGGRYRPTKLAASYARGLTPSIFFGFALSYTRTRIHYGFDRDTALAAGRDGLAADCGGAACGLENPLAAEHIEFDAVPGSALALSNFSVTAGAVIEVAPRFWLAASYRRAPSVDASLELVGAARIVQAERDGGATLDGLASVFIRLPSSIELGLRGPITQRLELITGASWRDLSQLDAFDLRLYGRAFEDAGAPEWIRRPRGYRDPVRMWAGVEQIDFGQRLLGGVRLSLATPSVDAAHMTASTIEGWSIGASVGGQLRLAPGLSMQLTYVGRWFPTTTVAASAYNPIDQLNCADSGYDFSTAACQAVREGYAQPTAAGSYGKHDHSARLGLRYDW